MIQITRDQTFTVVCNIRTPKDNGENVGTGFFVCKDNRIAYLVTATHVAKETNSLTYIVLCDSDNNIIRRNLNNLNIKLSWINHPVEDISALKIDLSNNIDILSERCFPYDQIEFDISKISRDDELTSVGFPNGYDVIGKFSPFTFRSYASSSEITLPRADTKTPAIFVCMENPSVGGYSGGPIFDLGIKKVGSMESSYGPTRLIGIMHGTILDNTGGKIAMFCPALYLKDII